MATDEPSERGAVIVSGGSRGLGLAIVYDLLDAGLRVATFARNRTAEVISLESSASDSFRFEEVDATDDAAVTAFVRATEDWGSGIWALVNNAAVGQDHLLAHTSIEIIDRVLEVNLRAPILLTRAVVKRLLLASRSGRIVNISSICGLRGYQGLTTYSATKGGLDAFTRALARELGPRGILVNAVAPGFFSSEMSAVLTEEQMDVIRRRTATGELTTPGQVAAVVRSLVLACDNVTGQVIVVDGGVSA